MKYTKSLLLGLIIVIFGLSSLSFWFGQKVSRRYTPLVEAALTIKLEATIAHLWFEEVVSGDRNEDINQVWGHLDQAEWYAQAMITGGENSKGVLIPLREEALLKTIQDVQIGLNSFRKIAQLRLMKQENDVGIGSEIDQKFDQVYENLFVQAGIVEQELKVQIAIANHRYKNIQITLQFGIFLWGLLLLWVIYRFEQNAMKLVETATKANRAKNSFLTIISHELRTPMNGVLGMTQLLRTTSLTEEQKDYCDIIMESGVRLVNTLTDILDFSKIEAESNNLTYSTFSLSKLVISSVKLFLGSAHAKGLALNYQIDPEIEDQVISDQEVLHRIFSNLVANGIKFTEKGEINIRLELIKKSEKVQRIGFVISDTGIGIPKEDQTDVFKPFKQVDGSSTRNFEGTGLGLFIVKSLVEMLGDEIKLEDNPSGGCRFVFEVTMEYSSAITQTKLENENPMTTYAPPPLFVSGPRILDFRP